MLEQENAKSTFIGFLFQKLQKKNKSSKSLPKKSIMFVQKCFEIPIFADFLLELLNSPLGGFSAHVRHGCEP